MARGDRFVMYFCSCTALITSFVAHATETITYSYDALGRLVASQSSGDVNNNQARSLCYDSAGNRTQFRSSSTGSLTGCVPTPTPTPAPPRFAIADASAVNEGGTLIYTVTRSGVVSGSLALNYSTANGTAISGSDYTAISGTLTFLSSETSKTIYVSTIDDNVYEPDETVLVNLSGATGGASIASAQASGSILNNDAANQPPTTVADTISVQKCGLASKNVVANDSDPEGNVPLVLLSATANPGRGDVSVVSSTTLSYQAYQSTGIDTITYIVRDSLGATSTGILTVTVTNTGVLCNAA